SPSDSAAATAERPRLNLGPYGQPYSSPTLTSLSDSSPRFESHVEVLGKAPRDPNLAMAVWWEHFNLSTAAIYGKGTIFRQAPPKGMIDVVPFVQWWLDKRKKKKEQEEP